MVWKLLDKLLGLFTLRCPKCGGRLTKERMYTPYSMRDSEVWVCKRCGEIWN